MRYSKLIVAAIGLAVLAIGPDGIGITSSEQATTIGEAVIALLTAFGVYAVPNAEAK